MKILFICKGNVARSQMAEAFFRKLSAGKADVISAGTKISGPEQPIGELLPAIQEILDAMREEGIDVSSYVRKQLTEEMLQDADKVIVIMENQESIPEYLMNSKKVTRWSIPDPKGKDIVFTRQVRDRIRAFVESLLKEVA